MTRDLVSVIIPTYNRASLVVEALASARAQTWPHVQIIVADDGSTDGTAELVAATPGVEYCRQERGGQGSARNMGLRLARGEYVASLDSDDLWEPDFLERSVGVLRESRASYVFSNWRESRDGKVTESGWERSGIWKRYAQKASHDWVHLSPSESRELYVIYCPSPSSALVLSRSVLSGWSEEARIADDWIMMLGVVFSRPCEGAFTMRRLWTKRSDGSNIYQGRGDLETLESLEVHDAQLMARLFGSRMSPREKKLLRARRAEAMLMLSLLAARRYGRVGPAFRYLAQSLWLHPSPFLRFGSRWVGRRLKQVVSGRPVAS